MSVKINFLKFCFLLLFVFKSFSYSQISDISFDHLFLEDGLSQSIVKSIIQDSDGFMYFGTEDGLNIFDAYSFKIFRNTDDYNSISYNDITSLCEDKYGKVWIGTFNSGISLYIPEKQKFHRFVFDANNPNSLSNNNINAITTDSKGNVWIGTDNGLSQFEPSSIEMNEYFVNRGIKLRNEKIALNKIKILSLFFDSNNLLWVGTNDGLYRILKSDLKNIYHLDKFIVDKTNPASISNNIIRSIFEDSKGRLWIGTDNGLNKLLQQSTMNENPDFINYYPGLNNVSLSHNEVYSIAEDSNNRIWIGTNGGGINIYNEDNDSFISYKHDPLDKRSLSSNSIRDLYLDRSGIMWIGTYGGGINKNSRGTGQFFHYKYRQNDNNSLSHPIVWSFYEDSDSLLWIGTHNGLNKLDRTSNTYTHYLPENKKNSISHHVIRVIAPTLDNKLILGTNGGGINIFDPKTEEFVHLLNDPTNSNSLSNNEIRALYQDSEGIIWIGTYGGGMDRYNPSNGVFNHFQNLPGNNNSISHNYVRVIVEDKNGFLWIGTEGGGLNKFDKSSGTFTRFTVEKNNQKSITSDYIFSIYIDNDTLLWLGTYGGGINKFNTITGEFENFTKTEGLPSNSVYGMIKNIDGNFWLSTNNGLSKFNPVNESFQNFNVKDGLQNNEFNGGAYFQSKSGELFFGGINGFNSFYPEMIKTNKYTPPVVITSFKVFNKEIDLSNPINTVKKIKLKHFENVFSIEFASLDFTSPEKNVYAYKLDGVDKDWVNVDSKKRFASYTTLSPGIYNFNLKGTNSDGLWNNQATVLTIEIIPPFWLRYWFIAIIILILLALIYYIYKRRLKIIRMKIELQTAHDAQLSIMPLCDPEIDSIDVSGSCFPAHEVGGDFFDYFWLENSPDIFGIMIGDVSGKAMKAAITAIMTSGMIISETKGNNSISKILYNVNDAVLEKIEKRVFVSLCISSINIKKKVLSLSNAGMNKPILLSKNKIEFLDSDGPRLPLGLVNNVEYLETNYKLNSGDLLIFTTDGITEAQNSKRQLFGTERLEEHLLGLDTNGLSSSEIKNSIITKVRSFTNSQNQSDDLTVLVLRIK